VSQAGITFALQGARYSFDNTPDERLFSHVAACAQAAEAAGFDFILPVDHFYQVGVNGPPEYPMLEAYMTAAALAPLTTRAFLGTLVTGVTYRNPAHLAKMITTLDVISGGRAMLGIGAAWNDEEHRAYGFDYPPLAERFEMLEEALQVCRLMFTQERATFTGKHYRVEGALNYPRPLQPGGPRILIGGSGEKKTLRLVAKYGDICNLLPAGVDEMRHKFEVLQGHCQAEGREYSDILRTIGIGLILNRDRTAAEAELERLVELRIEGAKRMNMAHSAESIRSSIVAGDPESVAEVLQGYVDAGCQGFSFSTFWLPEPRSFELAGEMIGLLRSA
jgi:F420-dependent oxidoreductase-like protein